jgi:Concanavalin A-like lectin/glucanases superfamily
MRVVLHAVRRPRERDRHTTRAAENPTRLPLNPWTHVTMTYDGANIRYYQNGTLVTTTPATGNMTNGNGALRIGGNSIWGEYFTGRIDEVRVYNRALSAAEITTDLNTAL